MAGHIYGAINLGSSELALKIFEINKKNGIRELTHVRKKYAIGAETYSTGVISYKTMTEICETLNDFTRIMNEFGVESSDVCATSGVREAENMLVLLDQIRIQTGYSVRTLSNSEARFLYYKALVQNESRLYDITQNGTMTVDVGAGSMQLSIFNESRLLTTQNLLLGASRIQELLQVMEEEAYDYNSLIDEYIEKDIKSFFKFNLNGIKIKNIIAVGGMIPDAYHYMRERKAEFDGFIKSKTINKAKVLSGLPRETVRLVLPTITILRKISELTGCDKLILSPIDLCDAMAAEYSARRIHISPNHDFTVDILTAARVIAAKYECDMEHIETIETLALQIFDRIKKLHGLGKRERLLLQIAVILHSIGSFISDMHSRENSYHIMMNTELIGISDKERLMIANIIRYNEDRFPDYLSLTDDISRQEYITVVKLNAILKTANVLDKSNRHKIKNVGITLDGDTMTLTAETMADITLEKGLFHDKAGAFEEVFGIRPKLIQKKTGRNL
ncbi:MAG: exopolyphosphatase [Eubacterium sp.]|nr:exopolyphosphatase [Eubacterium sp.]